MATTAEVDAELAGVLDKFELTSHAGAIGRTGFHSLRALLMCRDADVEKVIDALEDDEADRKSKRKFRDWLREAREAPPGQFSRIASKLNRGDLSRVEATTVLRVDVNPFVKGEEGKPKVNLRMAPGVVDKHVQAASASYVPVISLVGPTGAGKSFLTNLFLEEGSPQSCRPVVAGRNQHIPTSANVTLHRGAVQHSTDPGPGLPVLILDFEGEDGRTPKNLEEGYLRRLASCVTFGHHEDELKKSLEETMSQRQHVVKEVLPCLAYIISDVLVFVDQVEPRRTERRDRIRDFAMQAHQAVESSPWRPALVIIQNKWSHDPAEPAQFDITSEYDWLVESLASIFSSVKVVRVPLPAAGHVFEFGVRQLHECIYEVLQNVQDARRSVACLHAEPEFWCGFETLMNQLEQHDAIETVKRFESLSTILSRAATSHNPSDNVIFALELLGPVPQQNKEFTQRVAQVLDWYAYDLAGQVRFQGGDAPQQILEGLHVLYENLMDKLQGVEPCSSALDHDGCVHPCTQRRAGHTAGHRNPATIEVKSTNLLKRILWMRDSVPCTWPGAFQGSNSVSFSTLKEAYDRYARQMSACEYETAFAGTETAKRLQKFRARSAMKGVCFLCLHTTSDLIALSNPKCHHYLCRRCILMRQRLSSGDREVVCPFCAQKSELPAEPERGRLRVLSLDAGGLRGLVHVRMLQRLESRFAPLHIRSLFDLIVGVDTGGLVSMALLCGTSLASVEECLKKLAAILDTTLTLHDMLSKLIIGHIEHDSQTLHIAIRESLGEKWFQDKREELPCCCCLVAQTNLDGARGAGNFPKQLLSKNIPIHNDGLVDAMAYAATAVPRRMKAHKRSAEARHEQADKTTKTTFISFKNAVTEVCCPAKHAALVAEQMQQVDGLGDTMEMFVSLGTGKPKSGTTMAAVDAENLIDRGSRTIDMATSAEEEWKAFVKEVRGRAGLHDMPLMRLNPPDLGAVRAFSGQSVPYILSEINKYINTGIGKDELEQLFHLIYAKLWEVDGLTSSSIAGGDPQECRLKLRDLRFKFEDLDKEKLCDLITARQTTEMAVLQQMTRDELVKTAQSTFERQPFQPPLEGHFAYIFDGQDHDLEAGALSFVLEGTSAEMPMLQVVWRTERFGDFPVSGFPRLLRVRDISG